MPMPRFQFTLRDLFLMTTLIAVGVGGISWIGTHREFLDSGAGPLLGFAIISISIALIGAGAGMPFHAKAAGAYIAILVVVLAVILLEIISPGVRGVT